MKEEATRYSYHFNVHFPEIFVRKDKKNNTSPEYSLYANNKRELNKIILSSKSSLTMTEKMDLSPIAAMQKKMEDPSGDSLNDERK